MLASSAIRRQQDAFAVYMADTVLMIRPVHLFLLTIVKVMVFFVDLKNLFLSYFYIQAEKKRCLLTVNLFSRTLTIVNSSFAVIAGHQERLRE